MKESFQSVRDAGLQIPVLQRQKAHYEDMAQSIGVNLSGMPFHRSDTCKVEAAAVAMADLHTEICERLLAYANLIKQGQAIIDQMRTVRYKAILTERYINLCSWPEVTRRVGYKDEKSVFRAHGWALREAAAGCLPPGCCDTV